VMDVVTDDEYDDYVNSVVEDDCAN
jgi:hypothetical protein